MLLTNETSSWSAHKLSLEISLRLGGNSWDVLVINETWTLPTGFQIAKTWLSISPHNTVVFMSLYDPSANPFNLPSEFTEFDKSRIVYINSKDFCFWLLAVDRYFLNYSEEEVTPTEFNHKFLCYQRKPNLARNYLYTQLVNKQGIVTIGNKKFDSINSDIPEHSGINETIAIEELEVGNDIWSLGNIKIWNNSFLNIVSETQQPIDTKDPFVSEKIFKPIIGLRPFICFGHPNTTTLLKSLGFETFDEDFGYCPTTSWKNNAEQIANIVDNLDTGMYNKIKPKLIHNKNQLKISCEAEWKKINKLDDLYHHKCY